MSESVTIGMLRQRIGIVPVNVDIDQNGDPKLLFSYGSITLKYDTFKKLCLNYRGSHFIIKGKLRNLYNKYCDLLENANIERVSNITII